MQSLFAPDSKFMQAMSRLWDLVMLNILFLLTSLPIFTMGAASAALYTVCFRMDTDREEGLYRTYFSAFRQNFRQGTLLFLLFFIVIAAMLFNIALFFMQPGILHFFTYLFLLLLVVAALMYSCAFPLLSLFDNDNKTTLKNALALSVGYLPRFFLAAVLNCFPLVLFLMNLYTFLHMAFLWVFLYFSAAAYLNSRILNKVFLPYLNAKEETP